MQTAILLVVVGLGVLARCDLLAGDLAEIFEQTRGDAVGWFVGSASVSVLPTVNGRTDYFRPDPNNCCNPGTVVRRFDEGMVPVGNGARDARWVRDDCRATVVALRKGAARDAETLVLMGNDLYMLFSQDLHDYFEGVRAAVGDALYARLRFSVASDHNHHGPDTMQMPNAVWFDSMIRRLVQSTVTALNHMVEADISIADRQWSFGVGDGRDPRLLDRNLNVMSITNSSGRQIATIVQWAFHPEMTLGFRTETPAADCAVIGEAANCTSRDRYFSADYPGHMRDEIQRTLGGEVLYINGALGNQIGPRGPVWEPSAQCPITDGGAVLPPGCNQVAKDFRRPLIVGRELGRAVVAMTADRAHLRRLPADDGFTFRYVSMPYYAPVSNLKFQVAMAPASAIGGDPRRGLLMGNRLRQGYFCDYAEPLTAEQLATASAEQIAAAQPRNCRPDNPNRDFTWVYNPKYVVPLPARSSTHMLLPLHLIDFGRAGSAPMLRMMSMPGEMAPELVTGVPLDFDLPEGRRYYNTPDNHAVGADYVLPGTMHVMLQCRTRCAPGSTDCSSCWFMGLSGDELGYTFPIADWRVGCLDAFNATFCNSAQLDFPGDSMSGASCKRIMESRATSKAGEITGAAFSAHSLDELSRKVGRKLRVPTADEILRVMGDFRRKRSHEEEALHEVAQLRRATGASAVAAEAWTQAQIEDAQYLVCRWGQFGEARGHYEETNSAGWDLAAEWTAAVGRILGTAPRGRFVVN